MHSAKSQCKPEIFRDLLAGGCFPIAEPWDLSSAAALEARGFLALYARPWDMTITSSVNEQVDLAISLCGQVGAPVIIELRALDFCVPTHLMTAVESLIEVGAAGIAVVGSGSRSCLALDVVRECRAHVDRLGSTMLVFGTTPRLRQEEVAPIVAQIDALVGAGADAIILRSTASTSEVEQIARAISPMPLIVEFDDDNAFRIVDLAPIGVTGVIAAGMLAHSAIAGDEAAVHRLSDDRPIAKTHARQIFQEPPVVDECARSKALCEIRKQESECERSHHAIGQT